MKKWLCILCVMGIFLCFAGCKDQKEDAVQITTQAEEGCYRYEFVKWSIDQQVQTYEMVAAATSNSDLFLKLYEDGTAQMCIGTDVKQMQYKDGTIWLVDEPNNKMTLTLSANIATVTDGAYVFQFAAKLQ